MPVPPRKHTLHGAAIWSASGRLVGRVFDFVLMLILARLLTPEDFGVVAMAMSVLMVLEAVSELPVTQGLLRIREPEDTLYDTAFTLALLRAVVLGVVMVGLSWPMAAFFNESRVAPLMWALALAPMLRGCLSPRMSDFQRQFNFRKDFTIDVSGKFFALIVGATLAFTTGSYWAIAAGTIISPLVMNVLSYVLAPYRPRLSLAAWGEFQDLLGWNSLIQILMTLNWQFDRFVLGRAFPPDVLARFTVPSDLTGMAQQTLVLPATRPMITALTNLDDAHARGVLFAKSVNALLFMVGPVLIGLAICASQVIAVLLGPQWADAEPALRWLSVAALISLPVPVFRQLGMVTRQMQKTALLFLITVILQVPLVIVGVRAFGIEGALMARLITATVTVAAVAVLVRTMTGLSVAQQIASIRRTVPALLVMALLVHLAMSLVPSDLSPLLLAVALLVVNGVCMGVYLALGYVLWRLDGRPAGIEAKIFARFT